VLQRVGNSSVLGQAYVSIVNSARTVRILVVYSIFNYSTKFDCVKDIRFLLARQVLALGIAASLNVEYIVVSPNVFVIANEEALGVTTEGSFSSSR
jgi:hypothetical protein